MTDLEMVKKCAERMGIDYLLEDEHGNTGCGVFWTDPSDYYRTSEYDPLHDDAQAMALVKKFGLHVFIHSIKLQWCAGSQRIGENRYIKVMSPDLNRAIVVCVAQLP